MFDVVVAASELADARRQRALVAGQMVVQVADGDIGPLTD
jgi:hypothetical protein